MAQDDIQWLEEDTDPADIQWLEEEATAAVPPPAPAQQFEDPARDTNVLTDISREIGAGGYAATGFALEGLGEMAQRTAAPIARGLNWAFNTDFFRSENVLSGAATAIDKYSKEIEAGQSAEWREAKEGAAITGDVTSPSTWDWGKDPSLKGYAAQVLNVLGQAGPMAALAVATRGRGLVPQLGATGTVGAATTVGAGRSEILTEVESMSTQQLQAESALYRDRLAQGDTSAEARQKVIDTISDDAYWKLAGIGGLGGFATGYVLGGAAKKMGATAVARAGMEGVGEGAEELLEGIAKNDAFGAADIKKDLMEGSLGNLVMGAVGGATTAGALAVGGREIERVRDLVSRSETRRQEAAAAGEDALTQELAAGTGMAEDIQADAQQGVADTSEQDIKQFQARSDLLERITVGAEPSITEPAPEAPLPPADTTEAAKPEPIKIPDLDPTKDPGMIQLPDLDPTAPEITKIDMIPRKAGKLQPGSDVEVVDEVALSEQLPPVPEGFTRMFRAESPTISFDDKFGQTRLLEGQNPEQLPGKYWTPSPDLASTFLDIYGANNDAEMLWMDYPTTSLDSVKLNAVEFVIDTTIPIPPAEVTEAAGPEVSAPAMEAKKAERAEPTVEVPPAEDTRGKGVQYHGTSTPIAKLDEYTYSPLNIYGQGLYTTDATDIAEGYSKKGKGKQPTVYEVAPTKDLNLMDMEVPISPEVATILIEADEDFAEILDEVGNLREAYDEYRTFDAFKSADEVQETFDTIAYNLEAKGYDGLRHIGGLKTGRPAHNVEIIFSPATTATLKEGPAKRPAMEVKKAERAEVPAPPAEPEVEFPERNSRGDRFTSIRQVEATVERMASENRTRIETLSNEDAIQKKSEDVGISVDEMQELLSTNLAEAEKTIGALESFMASAPAKKLRAAERAKASKISFGEPAPDIGIPTSEPAPETSAMAVKRAAQLKRDEVDAAAAEAQASIDNDLPEPSEAQIEAENYKKGHAKVHGLDVAIENPRGSTRRGTDAQGKEWEATLKDHYGYIKRSEGADGDAVDVFIAPDVESDSIFVVDQVDPKTGKFDEHKVIMGAKTAKQARAIYKRNYARGWKGERTITEMTVPEFKTWLKEGDTTKAVKPMATDKAPPKPPVAKVPPPPAKGEPAFEAPTEKFTDYIRRRLQDKMHPLRQTQAEVAKKRGVEALPDELDALQAEESFYGKAEEHLRKLKDNLVRPLTEEMTKRNVSQAELDLYLYAKHAEERNEAIAEINPDMPDGGSGMTTAQADAILDRIEIDNRTADFEATSKYIYDILQAQRDTLKAGGLTVSDEVDVWEANYENYVPLKGHAQGEPDAKGSTRRAGRGFDIRGKETLRALGRRSLSESPMINAIIDSTAAITRAEKNKVGNVFLKLVEQNPNPEYWEVFTASEPDIKRGIKLIDGAETVAPTKVMNMGSDKYFSTKLDGVEYKVKINDERLLRAMQNLGPEPLGPVMKHLGAVTRFLSSMHTTYNPEFVISNVARDVQTAVLNVLAEQDIPGGRIKHEKIAGKMVKGIPVAVRAINASLHGKKLTGKAAEWQRVYEQFREAGAQTGWFDQKDFEGQVAEVKSMLTEAQGGVKGNAVKYARKTKDVVHHFNTAIENGVRLSAFKAAIEAGVSEQKAASMAKNLTVNFNRKGEVGNVLNTAYMFANASIQGTATFLRAMATMSKDVDTGKRKLNPAQKVAGVIAVASFGLATLNRMMAGEDDDGINWYDKVPQHVRERNIVIMESIFGGEEGAYFTFPLPYAYNIFHVFGDQAESVVSGAKEPLDAALNVVASLLGSFSPIGINLSDDPEKGVLRTLTPTVLSPVAQLAINENFFGSAIYRENMAFGNQYPDSALGKPKTADHWKAVSRWLNDATGGEEFIPGSIDINPDTLKFLAEFVGGGAGAFVVRTGDLAQKMFTGQEVAPHEVPFKRKLMGKVRPFEDLNKFYERRVKIGQHELQADSYVSKLEQRKYRRENEGILDMKGLAKRTGKKLSRQRKRRLKIIGNDKLTKIERDKQIKQLDRETKVYIDKFNKAYNAATKK
jgi:hypothetical protein